MGKHTLKSVYEEVRELVILFSGCVLISSILRSITLGGRLWGGSGGGGKRRREEWPKGFGEHLKFVLLKENIDTMSAVNTIAKHLKIKPQSILYAGTKDKRAVTAQWCSVYKKRSAKRSRSFSLIYGIFSRQTPNLH